MLRYVITAAAVLALASSTTTDECESEIGRLQYPNTWRNESVTTNYYGTLIKDPYRRFEDITSAETRTFIADQNKVSRKYLDSACPHRDRIQKRLTEFFNYDSYSCPEKHGSHYYIKFKRGLQQHEVIYVQDSLNSKQRTAFLDPNKWSKDGSISLNLALFTKDGSRAAYRTGLNGSDWQTIKFKEAPSGIDLNDTLENVKYCFMAWTHDGKGLFYSSYSSRDKGDVTKMDQNQKLFYHRMGTDQSQDVVVWESPKNPSWLIVPKVSDCGRYLILFPWKGDNKQVWIVDLQKVGNITGILPHTRIINDFNSKNDYVTNNGTVFTFITNLNATNSKLFNFDLLQPDQQYWTDLVPEDPNAVLLSAQCVDDDKLVLKYLEDVVHSIRIHDLRDGTHLQTIPKGQETVKCIIGKKDSPELFYKLVTFVNPGVIYHCNMKASLCSNKTELFKSTLKNFTSSDFETKQVFYTSKDGTRIPMFIAHKKGIKLDGNNPTILHGYGGFNQIIEMWFKPYLRVLFQHANGIYAQANIRGGGEYGTKWYQDGIQENIQNIFDDFQAAGEYLIKNNYTNSDKLAIHGSSHGGMMVATCLNQRPDLFAAGIPDVGLFDMLRFDHFGVGTFWRPNYGTSSVPEQFKNIIKFSPLHNIPKLGTKGSNATVQYPATLVYTAEYDDRVHPLHSYKFIAELQYTNGKNPLQTNPLLIYVDSKVGHGKGTSTGKLISKWTEIYSFLCSNQKWTWTD